MESVSIEHTVTLAQQRWPKTDWHIKSGDEACSPCPWCGGEDRFLLWQHGYYMCRPGEGHCGREGWLDEDQKPKWSPEELRLRRIEAEQARQRRRQDEHDRRLTALERMARSKDHERYHANLTGNEDAFEWFWEQGLKPASVFDFQLGVCPRCPTDREGRPSYTFPVWRKDGPLWTIRHRLQGAVNGDKYRPHLAGLGKQLVNARYLNDWTDQVVIIEGCKKARVVQQYDIPVVGILGKSGFEMRWLSWFSRNASICIALDPDAQGEAEKLAHSIAGVGADVRVARFPMKPDDLFLAGATKDDWMSYVKLAKRVH